ncbi:hypothetical protein [Sphingomonas nostoxanthinifaciens]|uniref:hypothetical protein n=1 Tax=Sphingomonas nostoxanthinifaciens TaxID=2872652 RepID=UPI001CC1D243|nr:hypothetical protein [Sphingomonas nostoxanthinifaciens]UAK23173.1 hypothetical protein K8P63_12195 [Sphingomonas nostoxanthinifaciens]
MRAWWLCPLLALASPSLAAAGEDEAHRLDRMETRRLNQAAAQRLPRRSLTPAEKALMMREEQAIAEWRRGAVPCGVGDRPAC